jgi:hypothetical protein
MVERVNDQTHDECCYEWHWVFVGYFGVEILRRGIAITRLQRLDGIANGLLHTFTYTQAMI